MIFRDRSGTTLESGVQIIRFTGEKSKEKYPEPLYEMKCPKCNRLFIARYDKKRKTCGNRDCYNWNHIDISGKRFGRAIAVKVVSKNSRNGRIWGCVCDCGNTFVTSVNQLKPAYTRSCGCLRTEVGRNKMNKYLKSGNAEKVRKSLIVENTNLTLLSAKNISRNTSGRKGVRWNKRTLKWNVRITFQKKRYFFGSYDKFEDAVLARETAEHLLWEPLFEKYLGKSTFNDEDEKHDFITKYIKEQIGSSNN